LRRQRFAFWPGASLQAMAPMRLALGGRLSHGGERSGAYRRSRQPHRDWVAGTGIPSPVPERSLTVEDNMFPRTEIGGVSVSRLVIGTNWFLGYAHCTRAKGRAVERLIMNTRSIADIVEVFFRAGVDTIMCPHTQTCMYDAIHEAEQRTGVKAIVASLVAVPVQPNTAEAGFDVGECERVFDEEVRKGVRICMPHQMITDRMLDKCSRRLRQMDTLCRLIRERGMIPGLSTHAPETIVYADETGLDVATYNQPFNAMGFLMQVEVDWVADVIRKARKPVIAIKPMAAGQLRPLQALTFVWNTIRDQDLVAAGTMAPEEARELVDLSLDILAHRASALELQRTRSKATL
jgi:hypothetical protein